jgi:hypothetical protein
MEYGIKIDSFGNCMHTRDEYYMEVENKDDRKVKIASNYKFYLAFENSMTDDYVTEKVW